MRHLLRLSAAVIAMLLAAPVAALPANAVAPITSDANWVGGTAPIATKTICIVTCQLYAGGATQVQYQGPITNIAIVPRVGERFYVHVWAENGWSQQASEAFRMQALLPDGLTMSIQSPSDVQCAITDSAYVQLRNMAPAECQDPVQSGLYWNFPAVELGAGERANFFFPVVANREINAQAMGVLTTMVRNPDGFSPNPLYSTINVSVLPANTPSPGQINAAPADQVATPAADSATTTTPSVSPGGTTTAPVTSVQAKGSTLTWSAPSGISGYVVQVSADKHRWKTIGHPSTTKFTWKKSVPGKWWVRIAEVTGATRGSWSQPVRVRLR